MFSKDSPSSRRFALVTLFLIGPALVFIHASTDLEAEAGKGGVVCQLNGPDGQPWPMNVTLQHVETGDEYTFASGLGRVITPLISAGKYKAFIRALWRQAGGFVGYVVDIQEVEVPAGDVTSIQSSFVEAGGRIGLPAFDSDFDSVIDRVEEEVGTDRMDSTDIPGAPRVEFDQGVLNEEEGWYRGDLRCYSNHSNGRLRVRDIVRRAEKLGLDFVAISDKRTLEQCKDPDYKSDKVLLIPAFEWGIDGHATCLGAKTAIKNWDNNAQVQAAIQLAHAQGVIFCITDPCSPKSPWEWSAVGFHAMEVWNKGWRAEPATEPEVLGRGELTRHMSASKAIRTSLAWDNMSKNSQTLKFWDAVLTERLPATAVGGSGTLDRLADLGSPITYVYARELSVQGILDGILHGRTFVSSGPDGPQLLFVGGVNPEGNFEGLQGSMIPIPSPEDAAMAEETIQFRVVVAGLKAKGTVRLNVIKNGQVWRTQEVDPENPVVNFSDSLLEPAYYRVELFQVADDRKAAKGYGNVEMLALSSPIYTDWVPRAVQIPSVPSEKEEQN